MQAKEMTATLRPVKPGQRIHFTGKVILPHGDPYFITKNMRSYQAPALRGSDQLLYLKFDQEKTFYKFKWRINEFGKPEKSEDADTYEAVRFLGKHTSVEVLYGDRNENLRGVPMFTLEFESERTNKSAELWLKRFNAATKLLAMTPIEKSDVAFRYGINAIGKTDLDLLIILGDYNSGCIMNTDLIPGEEQSYIDHFLENYNPTAQMEEIKTIVNKAIYHEVFTKNNNGYFLEKEHIGLRIDNLIAYLDKNPDMLQYVLNEIERKSLPPIDDSHLSNTPNTDSKTLTEQAKRLEKMQEMGKALRVRGWNTTNQDVLAKKLIDAQHTKAELEEYGVNRWRKAWHFMDDAEASLVHMRKERKEHSQPLYDREKNTDIVTDW